MNPLWKKIGLAAVAVAIVVGGVFYFTTSKGKGAAIAYVDPAFGEYISSYTAGVVSSRSSIRVVLAEAVADSNDVGTEVSASLFDLSPSVKGTTHWLDNRTLEFRPSSPLQSGQEYSVNFFLSKVMKVKDDLSTFRYSFKVIAQNFEITIDNLKPYVKTELKRQKIEGTLFTADVADGAEVEKVLTASQHGKNLSFTWTHAGDGRQHSFVVEEVARGEQASSVSLRSDGAALRVERSEEQVVEVPALSDFKLMTAKVIQNPSQHVVLQFSDPLKEKQDLDGLIRIDGLYSLEFDIRDNEILVYPPVRQTGEKTVYVESGLRNILDYRMKEITSTTITFEQVAPAVRFTGKGSILPSTHGLVLPFEAVNLRAVDVQIVKIFENNMLQFLQTNSLDGNGELKRVGKRLLKKTIALDNTGVTDLGKWNRFTLNLADLINTEPGAIYQIKLSFKKRHSVYACEDSESGEEEAGQFDAEEIDYEYEYGYDEGYYGSYDDYYYDGDYDWEERDNPCHSSYYNYSRAVRKNVLASDLGVTVKGGDNGSTHVFVTDLKSTEPLSGVAVDLYDFQQQLIGSATTDGNGKCVIDATGKPFALVAKNGSQRGYVKMTDGESLSLSSFDVSGEVVQKGLKGFLYGERGVWRPGDSLFLTFLLEDKNKLLPAAHPVVFEMSNPQGQVVNRLVRSASENGFYKFATATSPDAPTGNWLGRVKVGGTEFTQTLKIETIKPNRLKINLDFGTEKFTSPDVTGNLDVKWLHGAPGKNLKAEFTADFVPVPTRFDKYPDFIFEDPTRKFYSESESIFEGETDAEGKATFNASLNAPESPSGFLSAIFQGKVFEESGNFSTDRFTLPYSPYSSYTGIRIPEGEKYSGILYLDKTHTINVVTVDDNGKPVSRNNLEATLHKVEWRWWWDNSYETTSNFVDGYHSQLVRSGTINTVNGKGSWSFEVKTPEWGRYFLRVCDPSSGHCAAQVLYIDEPGWSSRSRSEGSSEGATLLSFTTDKESYSIGEKVNLTIPGSANGRALVSIETGSRVLESHWVQTQAGETRFSFDTRSEMAPTAYAHVMLLQPHAQSNNDLPIRLYGVVPIKVEDPATHLEPVIAMPEVLEPGEPVTIKVSEKSKRTMTYTVAVVDEGLLDLTRFKTPDAWNRFYAREALGVRTWDVFDQVLGAFGAHVERLISIGGDMEAMKSEDGARANRFKPVVKYLGPFTLGKGDTDEHTFIMPQYIGSVRTMVIAGYEGAYGKAEKATPVRKPLMVLATLPRVLGPEEKLKLPITLFAQEKSIRNVKVDVRVTGPLALEGNATQTASLNGTDDLTLDFDLAVKSQVGVATVEVTATSGNYKAVDKIEIDVRNPNSLVTKVVGAPLDAGKTWNHELVPFGVAGTNAAMLEVSSIPPINMGSRLRYLIRYPHGCIEQTTSSVFPQLFLDQVKSLTETEKNTIQRNINAGINRLKSFVQRDGGFGYWPGYAEGSDAWGTTYAGHFLTEAEARGYYVPGDMMKRWRKYQKDRAQEWRSNQYYNNDLMQAYRLYTLALAGSPEMGAMNRLREQTNLSSTAAWMLASAYAKAGQPEAAKKLIEKLPSAVKPYRELDYTYGSEVRDMAIIMETLTALGNRTAAFTLLQELAKTLSNDNYWLSTQDVAFSLKAISVFVGSDKRGAVKFTYALDGKKTTASTDLPIAQVTVPIEGTKKESIQIVNESTGPLFVRVIAEGTPARGAEEDGQSNLTIAVRYTTPEGAEIDPTTLEQGTEFVAEVTAQHTGIRSSYENLALTQVFPSGWEINNLRLHDAEETNGANTFTYQDIRDDRVYTYFNLYRNQRKTFRVLLTATYAGTYYLPGASCEAMYDNSIYARKRGTEIQVLKR